MKDFTVIMPCYILTDELLDLTAEAIKSLGEVNLIIIDNNSLIGGGYLRSVADTYIRNKENLGYAKAVNMGLKLSSTPYVAIANNDIRVSPNWKEVTKEVFSEDGVYSCHFRMTDYNVPFEYGNKIIYKGKERWCTSSFFVLKNGRTKLFLYDENYLNSYDDWNYWKTVRNAGYKQAYTDKACYQHHHSFTQQLIPEREINNQKNREYFKKTWGGYAEDLFALEFPEQVKIPYEEGFKL